MSAGTNIAWTTQLPPEWVHDCGQDVFEEARSAYDSPGRFYHTWAHIESCIHRLRELSEDVPQESFLAILFHDAIYVAGRSDNEELSASFARKILESHSKVPAQKIDAISRTILATRNHVAAPSDISEGGRLALDADMSIMAAPWDQYKGYVEGVRNEYVPTVVSARGFRVGRIAFLRSTLEAPHLYHSQVARTHWEAPARNNAARELHVLLAEQSIVERLLAFVYGLVKK